MRVCDYSADGKLPCPICFQRFKKGGLQTHAQRCGIEKVPKQKGGYTTSPAGTRKRKRKPDAVDDDDDEPSTAKAAAVASTDMQDDVIMQVTPAPYSTPLQQAMSPAAVQQGKPLICCICGLGGKARGSIGKHSGKNRPATCLANFHQDCYYEHGCALCKYKPTSSSSCKRKRTTPHSTPVRTALDSAAGSVGSAAARRVTYSADS
eukprot:6242-Heterococcus_DN1.PRE.7